MRSAFRYFNRANRKQRFPDIVLKDLRESSRIVLTLSLLGIPNQSPIKINGEFDLIFSHSCDDSDCHEPWRYCRSTAADCSAGMGWPIWQIPDLFCHFGFPLPLILRSLPIYLPFLALSEVI